MSSRYKLLLALLIITGVAIAARNIWVARHHPSTTSRMVEGYVRALYARDFEKAYGFISSKDRAKKERLAYIDEQRPFTGFTLRLARKLAESVEVIPAQHLNGTDHARAKFEVAVPDVERLAPELLDWDEDRLNALSSAEQQKLLAKVERWQREKKLPLTRVEETFDVVKEADGWKVVLNWRSSVVVEVAVQLPDTAPLEVQAVPPEVVFRPGEPFTINVKIRNTSTQTVRARVAHGVEPANLEKYLGVGDCGTFVPLRLAAGEEDQNRSTFLVWTDLPPDIKKFRMTYNFEVDQPQK